jgi:hypothetical protein
MSRVQVRTPERGLVSRRQVGKAEARPIHGPSTRILPRTSSDEPRLRTEIGSIEQLPARLPS